MTARQMQLLGAAAAGDQIAEQTLLEENSGLLYAVERRFAGRGIEREDLHQLACVGFIKAVRGFDAARGTAFSTYAVPKIMGEIRRFLRDDGLLHVSRTIKEQATRLAQLREGLEEEYGRAVTVSELAAVSGMEAAEVAACEQSRVSVDSLERELTGGCCVGELVGDGGMEESTCRRLSLQQALRQLSERAQRVLQLRYFRDLTQMQTARLIGVSQVQVSRIEKQALQTLRQLLEEE